MSEGKSEYGSGRTAAWDEVRKGMIAQTIAGSELHGVTTGDDDRDIMAVYIPSPERALGLDRMEHYRWRTKPEGERSEAGDVDFVAYSLNKFARLAAKGNPTVLQMFWVRPEHHVMGYGHYWPMILEHHDLFLTKRALRAYQGYATHQYERMIGTRKGRRPNRPELIEKYGYDTKFAYHALRLAYQGVELANTRRVKLPMSEGDKVYLKGVRTGGLSFEEAKDDLRAALDQLDWAVERSTWPDSPPRDEVSELIADVYQRFWREN